MLPQDAINEFKDLYRKQYGVVLSDTEAARRANNLMRLYRAVLKPSTSVLEQASDDHATGNNHN